MNKKLVVLVCSLALVVGLAIGMMGAPKVMAAGGAMPHPEMTRAISQLETTRNQLRSGETVFGGHRMRAIQLVNQAIQQLQQGLAYARQHRH